MSRNPIIAAFVIAGAVFVTLLVSTARKKEQAPGPEEPPRIALSQSSVDTLLADLPSGRLDLVPPPPPEGTDDEPSAAEPEAPAAILMPEFVPEPPATPDPEAATPPVALALPPSLVASGDPEFPTATDFSLPRQPSIPDPSSPAGAGTRISPRSGPPAPQPDPHPFLPAAAPPIDSSGSGIAVTPEEPGEAMAAWLSRTEDPEAIHPFAVQEPVSPYEIKAGSIINATLITGINSDLPGLVIAQVDAPVFDTVSGDWLLIPQGTRMLGVYESSQNFGDIRVGISWNRLIFPNGDSISIPDTQGTDTTGAAGVRDKVNRHLWRIYTSAAILAGISAGVSLATQPESIANTSAGTAGAVVGYGAMTPQQTVSQELALNLGRTLNQQLQRSVDIQPTIIVRPGKKLAALVAADLAFETPWPQAPGRPLRDSDPPAYWDPTWSKAEPR